MTATHAPAPPDQRRPASARRFGYLVAIVVNAVMLWLAHQVLDWGWPGFLTADLADVLWLISASLVASMIVNATYLVHDGDRYRAAGDLVTAAFALAVSVRMWRVFPFDFSAYATDWTWLFRVALVVAIVGTVIAMLVDVGKLVRPASGPGRSPLHGVRHEGDPRR